MISAVNIVFIIIMIIIIIIRVILFHFLFPIQKPLDAEELSECKLSIRGISSEREEQTQLIVKIINENDHAPTFSHALHVGHVNEGLPEDSAVLGGDGKPLVIHASDADVSDNDLMYEVVGSTAFTIDSQTGALLTTEVEHTVKIRV